MNNEKGIAHLLLLLFIVAVVGGTVYLFYKGIIKLPSSVPLLQNQPKVELKSEYKNPFNKDTQYVNPFDKYKNPFVVNK